MGAKRGLHVVCGRGVEPFANSIAFWKSNQTLNHVQIFSLRS